MPWAALRRHRYRHRRLTKQNAPQRFKPLNSKLTYHTNQGKTNETYKANYIYIYQHFAL